jgi:hypothetical protein
MLVSRARTVDLRGLVIDFPKHTHTKANIIDLDMRRSMLVLLIWR